jgi:primosomal protein N' (replication factor Y)
VIQTRIPENLILRNILSGNVLPLYREDLEERKHFGYPPFKRLIKITFTGSKAETERARAFIEETFTAFDPQIFSAFVGKIRGKYVTNTVIKLWALPTNGDIKRSEELHQKLSQLPPSFSVNVDPEDLL